MKKPQKPQQLKSIQKPNKQMMNKPNISKLSKVPQESVRLINQVSVSWGFNRKTHRARTNKTSQNKIMSHKKYQPLTNQTLVVETQISGKIFLVKKFVRQITRQKQHQR